MPGYYIYLISSLPMLQFGMKSPFSFEAFLVFCRGKISDQDIAILASVSMSGEDLEKDTTVAVLKKWRTFDMALRNELVRIRAQRRGRDPQKYIRQDGYTDPSIVRIAMNAYRNPSVMDAERILDEERWRILDELSVGHYFDIDFLIIYALKLLIVERWQRIRSAESVALLEQTLK